MEAKARAEAEQQQLEYREREQTQRMIDRLRINRDTAQAVFKTLLESANHFSHLSEITPSAVKKLQTQLEAAFTECKQTNSALLDLLPRESAEWIPNLQGRYSEIVEMLDNRIDKQESKKRMKAGSRTQVE